MPGQLAPWRRFEAKVDPAGQLPHTERARRAKIAYRAFMRRIARKSVRARAATKARKDAARARRAAKEPSEVELEEFRRERDLEIAAQIIWAAAQRGERGINGLKRRQLEVRADCILCGRPFTEADRAAAIGRSSRAARAT